MKNAVTAAPAAIVSIAGAGNALTDFFRMDVNRRQRPRRHARIREKGGESMEQKEKDAVIEARNLVLSARKNMGIITEAGVEKMNEAARMDGGEG